MSISGFSWPPRSLPAKRSLRRTHRRRPAVAASAIEELLLAVRCRPAIAALAVGRGAAMHGERLRAKGPTSARWELAPTHQDLERAGLVVVKAPRCFPSWVGRRSGQRR